MNHIKDHPILMAFVVIVMGVAGLLVATYVENQQQTAVWGGGGPTVVVTEPVRMQTIVEVIESLGTALANESVSLTSKVTDTVRKVNFEDGDYVEAGAILVELTKAEETAMLAEAQATLDETTRQLQRIQNLIDQKLASELQLDEERARKQTATARLEAILARLDDRLFRAPFSGILGFRNVSPGTLLTQNTVVTTLDDINTIKLDFTIPENFLAVVQSGLEVTARSVAYPDEAFKGQVTTVNSRVDPVTRAVSVRANLDNEARLLRPGMLLSVTVTQRKSDAMVVPEESVIPIQSQEYVFTVSADNRAERVMIETGRRRPGIIEVISGLETGQEVITQGVIKIRPGAPVTRNPAG